MILEPRCLLQNFDLETCVADNKFGRWEVNFFDTLEECCKFPWLLEKKCIRLGSKPPTSGPTVHPTKAPTKASKRPTKAPTASPSKNPISRSPTGAPTTPSPSFSPITPFPSYSPVQREETTTTATTITTTSTMITTTATSQQISSTPTFNQTNEPTMESCDNKWHVSVQVNEIQSCTNSLDYPSAWDSNTALKAKMLLDTPEQCCSNNFSGKTCNVVNVCGGAGESEVPNEGGECNSLWHLSVENSKAW
jgi:hypothetical protein